MRRDADPRLGAISAPDEPKPRTPRSVSGSSSTSRLDSARTARRRAGRSASGLDDERRRRGRCCAGSRAARRGSRSRQAGRVQHRDPMPRCQPRTRLDEPGVPPESRPRAPCRRRPARRARLGALARDEVEARIARVGALGDDRVLVQALERAARSRCARAMPHRPRHEERCERRRSAWLRRARTKTPSSRSIRSSTGAPSSYSSASLSPASYGIRSRTASNRSANRAATAARSSSSPSPVWADT